MSTTEGRSSDQSTQKADLKLEVVVISVSDVDRAKQFYGNLGWRLDADFPFDRHERPIQRLLPR
jgi:predicted enzyme related to lactoylglutathione lyase